MSRISTSLNELEEEYPDILEMVLSIIVSYIIKDVFNIVSVIR